MIDELDIITCPKCSSSMKSEHGVWKCVSCGHIDDE